MGRLDEVPELTVVKTNDTACADCAFRHKDPLKSGVCLVYPSCKPGCVFRGGVCDYYERDSSGGQH